MINYAEKYSNNVDERFTQESITGVAVNADYDWEGTSAIKVYSVDTAPLNDYSLTGNNRYGTPSELGNETQTMLLSQDKAFTFTIDRKSYDDTQMTMEAGKALQRQLAEVVIPYVDEYRLQRMVNAVGSSAVSTIDKTNAYDKFLDGQVALNTAKVPKKGRIAYVSGLFYKSLKQDDSFVKAGDLSQEMLLTGQLGQCDGVAILDGSGILPENVNFIITHPVATTAAQKLESYKIHQDPPGINGWLVEGRIRFDAFVRHNKKGAIYVDATEIITSDGSAEFDTPVVYVEKEIVSNGTYDPADDEATAYSKVTVTVPEA